MASSRASLAGDCATPLSSGSSQSNIRVCVRLRPFSKRELDKGEDTCVRTTSNSSLVVFDGNGERTFTFDRVFNSLVPNDPNAATQETLMVDIGSDLRDNALSGYNSCLFAYGQTGSGKTHSVLGAPLPLEMRGLLPRIADAIFDAIDAEENNTHDPSTFNVCVSYLEVYQERIRDLLTPPATNSNLHVRQNPKLGVYVQNLREVPVSSKEDVQSWLAFGAKARTVAATCMNDHSSRSHCIFTLDIQRCRQLPDGRKSRLRSKVNMVDLAGSERQKKTNATGMRLTESGAINKSLFVLAQVTSKLAERDFSGEGAATSLGYSPSKKSEHIPFRDSKLTHLLQDSLSGNSKTVMIAALSPALSNFEETLSTLRFAESVKSIKMRISKNEETEEDLRAELEHLRAQLARGSVKDGSESVDVAEFEAQIAKFSRDKAEQLEIARKLQEQRQQALNQMGLSLTDMSESLGMAQDAPQLVNVSTDAALTGCLVYFFPPGHSANVGSSKDCKITLSGIGMAPIMATITGKEDGNLTIMAIRETRVLVNGRKVSTSKHQVLKSRDRLILGHAYCFLVHLPNVQVDDKDLHSDTQKVLLEGDIPEGSEAYNRCQFFISELRTRIGDDKAKTFLANYGRMLNLVDMANHITDEVRPNDRFKFCLEILTDLYKYQEEAPECAVRLKKFHKRMPRPPTPAAGLLQRRVAEPRVDSKRDKSGRAKMLEVPKRVTSGGGDPPATPSAAVPPTPNSVRVGAATGEPFDTVAVLDVDAFDVRLEHLRDLYQLFSTEGSAALEFGRHIDDPWRMADQQSWIGVLDSSPRNNDVGPRFSDAREVSKHTAESVANKLPPGPRICILGGTKFQDPDTEALVTAIAGRMSKRLAEKCVVLTGGMPGVQAAFAKGFGASESLIHLLPEGQASQFGVGRDVSCGATLEERMEFFGQLGQVYITFEGGPGVAKESRQAFARGAFILPIISTGGASGGMFDFPRGALEKPAHASDAQWSCITGKVTKEHASAAVIDLILARIKTRAEHLPQAQHMAEVNEIKFQHKQEMDAKDSEIKQLRAELDMLRSGSSQGAALRTVCELSEEASPPSGQALTQVEQTAGAVFASKFLSSLREMKQDLQSQSEAIQSIRWEVGKVGGPSSTR